ncbi:sugar phosphate isomerase/epimerase family protein [Paenibacillus whitsoniae]|uniref:sugar phosphate isomerase/epimerase family protein n=1 Tax=Paenibacillus whitsoniae TaxID=2496558 RepID=UPI0013E02640|nr:sugar phosphate isomerase/epimerase family protein [Paenibacillus whitsoniae]
MKLAISNIAWDSRLNEEITTLLKINNVEGLEVAPTKVISDPEIVEKAVISKYKSFWENEGFKLIAMQSLLFGKPHLSIFGDRISQKHTLDYLQKIINMASMMGTNVLVFGSPKNRYIKDISDNEAYNQALEFFHILGEMARKKSVSFCIEANPVAYGCNFLTGTLETLEFVKELNHPSIKLQIDTGTIFINNESPHDILEKSYPYIGHFHISEPFLNLIGKENHSKVAACLREMHYDGWLSIEMKNNLLESDVVAVKQALEFVANTYFDIKRGDQ